MKIAVASGKGGTGKTTVATNYALYLSRKGSTVSYTDCDVEEPNGHLFLKPANVTTGNAEVPVPVIDEGKCTACGRCVNICEFNALVRIGTTVMVFAELCHGCGGCMRICPEDALHEENRTIGEVMCGKSDSIGFTGGKLAIGEAMSPPLIRQVIAATPMADMMIFDAPPGTSCPVVTVVKQADFVVLVTEPTPFGLHDLALAIDMVRLLGKPCGVVINRDDPSIDDADCFCRESGVPVLGRIPDKRSIAEAYSRGEMLIDAVSVFEISIAQLYDNLIRMVSA